MQVKIINAPEGLDLKGIVSLAVHHLEKAISIDDPKLSKLYIVNGDDEDIRKLLTMAGITAKKIF